LNLTVTDGKANQKNVVVTAANLATLSGPQGANALVGLINAAWDALDVTGTSAPLETGSIAAVAGGNQVKLTSQGTGTGAQVYVQDSTAAEALGLTSSALGETSQSNGATKPWPMSRRSSTSRRRRRWGRAPRRPTSR